MLKKKRKKKMAQGQKWICKMLDRRKHDSFAWNYPYHEGKGGLIEIKLDVQKAYDRVDWCVLRKLLEDLGFQQRFIFLHMHYVSSTSFKLLLSGNIVGSFATRRGLYKGDPLSPFFAYHLFQAPVTYVI